jgi:hypothetical protein
VGDEWLGGGLLFTSARFHDLNEVPAGNRWRYEHRREGRLVGVLDGVVTDGVFVSGHSAPFGGPDLVRPDPTVDDVVDLLGGAVAALERDGVRMARVRSRPAPYSPAEPLLEYALHDAGFAVELCALNQHVDLHHLPEPGEPLSLLSRKRARDVRADLRLPYAMTDVEDDDDLTTCHAVLAANRAAHGRPRGLARDYLDRVRRAFPDRVRMHLLRHAGRAVAAAVVYRVLDDVDLLVAWGDAAEHGLQRSPMNLLAHELLLRSLRGGARLFDLGPSSEPDGTPNVGLAHFKRSVGAVPGTRKVFLRAFTDRP